MSEERSAAEPRSDHQQMAQRAMSEERSAAEPRSDHEQVAQRAMGEERTDHPRLYNQPFPTGEYRFLQLGFIVEDLVAASTRWHELYGAGPWFIMQPAIDLPITWHGRPGAVSYQLAVTQLGPLQVELIQQLCDRPSPFKEMYGSAPTGVNQLCTTTPDYDATMAHYRSLDRAPICELVTAIGRVGYVDTRPDNSLITEVVEESTMFHEMLARTAAVCARWDGTDPVRILRPTGGYDVPHA